MNVTRVGNDFQISGLRNAGKLFAHRPNIFFDAGHFCSSDYSSSATMDNALSKTNSEPLQREAQTLKMTPCNVLCLICRCDMLILFVSSGAPGADAPSSTPERAGNDPCQKIDFSDQPQPQPECKIMIKAFPKNFFSAAMANDPRSLSGAAAGSLLALSGQPVITITPIYRDRDSGDTSASRADTTAPSAPIVGSPADERAAPGIHPSDSLLS